MVPSLKVRSFSLLFSRLLAMQFLEWQKLYPSFDSVLLYSICLYCELSPGLFALYT
uniref:Uncharacterized protein n=1 Tax=Rhinopithecus roxellana TaxID=61622 RepID=A0A2K6NRL2_RHIRO